MLRQTSSASVAEESVYFTGINHWVCSSSIGGYVLVYDSVASRDLTSSTKVPLSECYKSLWKRNLKLNCLQLKSSGEESIEVSLPLPSLVTLQVEMTRRKFPIARAECATIRFAV